MICKSWESTGGLKMMLRWCGGIPCSRRLTVTCMRLDDGLLSIVFTSTADRQRGGQPTRTDARFGDADRRYVPSIRVRRDPLRWRNNATLPTNIDTPSCGSQRSILLVTIVAECPTRPRRPPRPARPTSLRFHPYVHRRRLRAPNWRWRANGYSSSQGLRLPWCLCY